ncbi:putative permease [Anaerohalosphaera lusitana]|uniref:Putative permease n=1 Tax=Anaerohalosphaera lusitana TaxID=1936003 RepID=A0A1U9NNK3_9BACT|nr:SO_0444 family Cu/Zn efflux transporter [Anaerohalosphaera lusitana]AQT69469.1 putative permease [Anaerohalosphaera lusitana]
MDTIVMLAGEFWGTLTEMAPYLLFGFLVAGILSVILSARFVENHLGGGGFWPVVKASLFGVPLPLCSCGVIPVGMSLRKHGAAKGATVSFLLSTPQTGVDSILATYALLGPIFAVFRPVIAFITGLIGGFAVQLTGGSGEKVAGEVADGAEEEDSCCGGKKQPFWLIRLFKHGFVTLPRDIGRPMIVGIIIAAILAAVIPDDFFASHVSAGLPSMLLMLVFGIPLYVCATASIPVAAVLVAKGLTPGAALVFLMTGPATNAATFTTLWNIMGRKTALIYLLTVVVCALSAGFLLDAMFPGIGGRVAEHMHEMDTAWWQHAAGILLLVVLVPGLFKKKHKEMAK